MSSQESTYDQLRTRLLAVGQVAELLGISTRTVQRLVKRGELPYVRLGGVTRFRTGDVERLVRRSVISTEPGSLGAGPPGPPVGSRADLRGDRR